MCTDNETNLQELQIYLNRIFPLEQEIKAKNHKIRVLEFELQLEKHLLETLKHVTFPK